MCVWFLFMCISISGFSAFYLTELVFAKKKTRKGVFCSDLGFKIKNKKGTVSGKCL